ncbi:TlpA family protein disulfide reductase [Actinomyces minihominis]|uniref:TlpA family protein disulfide reductase n=1 Tax=Actinomyces minihominis TaxID=2002838 RepID=UPI000C070891|nr:redoxin domain-containing protein [Actinomyces minihominis]
MPDSASVPSSRWRRFQLSTLGNVVVLALVVVAVLVTMWIISAARDGGSTGGAMSGASPVEVPASTQKLPSVGEAVPEVSAVDLAGERVQVGGNQGKPMWLSFNATWCSNCRAEMPDIQSMFEQYGEDVAFAAVYVGEGDGVVSGFVERLDLTFPQIADIEREIASVFGVVGLPSHFFIDAQGNLAATHVGVLSEKMMKEKLDALG